MLNNKYVVIIDDSRDVIDMAEKLFKAEKDFEFIHSTSEKEDVKTALNNMPDLIIINEDGIENNIFNLCDRIRRDKDNSITPIIVTSTNKDEDFRVKVLSCLVEYYIRKPLKEEYFYHTIKNLSRLIYSNRCISPLTNLPGNVQIDAELKRRIAKKKLYAVLYTDLDNFKSYNDTYGFMNGDEVIKFTSQVIQESIKKYGRKGDFLGHIGGDDFVLIVDYENARKIGREITKLFDEGIEEFYKDEDLKNGGVKVANRKGKMEKFPIMTISVAMISNRYKRYTTPLEIGEDGAGVKKKAKIIPGSSFLENRRKGSMRE